MYKHPSIYKRVSASVNNSYSRLSSKVNSLRAIVNNEELVESHEDTLQRMSSSIEYYYYQTTQTDQESNPDSN